MHQSYLAQKLQNQSAQFARAAQTKTKVLIITAPQYRPFLTSLKKEIIAAAGARINDFVIDFVSSQGLAKDTFEKLEPRYDYFGIACPATASFICPEGISFFDAAGSLYQNKFLILTDPQHIHTIPYGAHLLRRYLEKILQPHKFISFPPFTWNRLATHEEFEGFFQLATNALFLAADIETVKKGLGITCISFSLLCADGQIRTGVLDCEDDMFYARMRRILNLPVAKTYQNGLYDNLYLLRWNSPTTNWVHDTSYAMHSHYSEMPKDLGFLSGYHIRDFQYWKQEGRKAKSKEEYHAYNAKDTYATLCIAISQILTEPEWAKENFLINFPNVFPCLYMNAHGLRIDEEIRKEVEHEADAKYNSLCYSLEVMTSIKGFNAGSWQQVQKLFAIYGITTKTGEKELMQAGAQHPLLGRFVEKILAAREQKTALDRYLRADLLDGRLLYNVHPCGTETGRFASQKSSFWCGVQIQNQPPYAKCYIQADDGWEFAEIDNEQSESRTTAYLAEDTNLIATLESGKDFHSTNAVKFFGMVYEEVKQKMADGSDSPGRALAKRINHAVSYNMGAAMFVYQAGREMMELARRELKLPRYYTHLQIAEHLINLFDRSYPKVRHDFQKAIVREITFTNRLVGPTGWTRWFFSNPSLTKPALNASVAHGPQSLSVQIINMGLRRIWSELMLRGANIRLLGQIHDSIFFMYRPEERETIIPQVEEKMRNAVSVHGRTLIIPTATKLTGKYWAKRKKI